MQICFFLPAPADAVSGGHAYDRRMIGALAGAGHEVHIIGLAGRHPFADAAAEAAARAAFAAMTEGTLAVIDGMCLPAFAPIAEAFARRRVVGLIHHPTALEPGESAAAREALRAIERQLYGTLPRIIVTSAETARQLGAEFAVAEERITIVEPGTAPAPRSPGSGGPDCALLALGMLIARKGHDVLLRALARLPDLDWRLTIAGSDAREPGHAPELAALAAELNIAGRVRFAGELRDAALEEAWRGADIFALAPWWEGYGMAIAEALKRGVPVAITGGGAAGALVPPEAGVVAPPGDVATLSKGLRRMIFDADLRRTMAQAAFAAGTRLPSWESQCSRFLAALD